MTPEEQAAEVQEVVRDALHRLRKHEWPMAEACAACDQNADQIATALAPVLREAERRGAERAWEAALDHVWELSDPAWTVVAGTAASTPVVTEFDVNQAKRDNPYAEGGERDE